MNGSISIAYLKNVPDDVLKQMIDMSYELALSSFSKKMQKEILQVDKND